MSRIYVDRVTPYQSASVTIDNLSAPTLTSKTEFNSYTSSNDSKVTNLINATSSFASTGANTFNGTQTITGSVLQSGDSAEWNVGNGNKKFLIQTPTNEIYTGGSNEQWGLNNKPFTKGLTMSNTYGFNVFNSSYTKDAGFSLDVNTASGQGPNKVGIWGAGNGTYNTFITFEDNTNWTDGRVEFHTPISASAGIQGPLVISGSIDNNAGGGNNTFNQNTAQFNVATGNKKFHIVGSSYEIYSANDSWQLNDTPFTEGIQIGNTYGVNFYNSSFTKDFGMSINMNTSAGTGTNKIGIWGAGSGGYYDFISFEDATNWTDGRIEVHRTLQVDEVLQLQPQDPLPTGALGQLAVSGSDLYFHNGSSWVVK